MRKPAHNALLPFPMTIGGQVYASLTALHSGIVPPAAVSLSTLATRLRTRLASGTLDSAVVLECLHLPVEAYRQKYGVRTTLVLTSRGETTGEKIYAELGAKVSYSAFRQRINAGRPTDGTAFRDDFLREAATLDEHEWTVLYGGGRRKGFIYEGDLHPEHRGEHSGFTAFLKRIGRWDERHTLQARRKARWDIDDLLREPPMREGQPGFIYRLTETATARIYVGLSVNPPHVRFRQHLLSAAAGSGARIHQALRASGEAGFALDILQEVAGGEEALAEAERIWIGTLDALGPNGLNARQGGSIGRYDGIPVTFEGRKFRSISARDRHIARTRGVPLHVVEKAMREGREVPESPRSHSRHPDAGSPLFRQFLGIQKRAGDTGAGVEPGFNYDTFKSAVLALEGEGDVTRIRLDEPWGPLNLCRMSAAEIVERAHGKVFRVGDQEFPSKAAALRHHRIPRNTFAMRIAAGWTVEKALSEPLGATSKQPFHWEGVDYPSKSAGYRAIAEAHGRTPDQIKDYFRRGLAPEEWP